MTEIMTIQPFRYPLIILSLLEKRSNIKFTNKRRSNHDAYALDRKQMTVHCLF